MTERTMHAVVEPSSTRASQASGTDRARARPGLVLGIVVACQLMLVLDVTVMNVALPAIQRDLHFSATGLSWVISAYTLAFGGLLLLGGRAGDLLGRRRLFTAGIAAFTLASLLGGIATSPGWLLAARVGQGVAAAAAGPNALALLVTTFRRPRERVRALAVFSAMSSSGFAIGLLVGGALTEWVSWRAVLFINVPFGLAVAALAPRVLAEPPRHRIPLDVPGAVTGTLGASSLVYALIRAAGSGWSDRLVLAAFVVAAVLLAGFAASQARAAQPLLPLRLLADRNRGFGYLMFTLLAAAMLAMWFFLTLFVQNGVRFSPLRTGLAFLPMALVMLTVIRILPVVLPRIGPKWTVIPGVALLVAGVAWLTQISAGTGYVSGLLGPMVLFGLGAGLGAASINVVIMHGVAPADSGAAAGMLQTAQQVGGSLGLAVLVSVFGAATRHPDPGSSPHAVLAHGVATGFAVSTAFAAAGLATALFLRPLRQQS